MRQITEKAREAFLNYGTFKRDNTEVRQVHGTSELRLHGHLIATLDSSDGLMINDCGWDTPTTRDRLNALPGVSLYQKDFVQYLRTPEGDIPWTGRWISIG